jgi:predicted alpha-1,2-mannosidase
MARLIDSVNCFMGTGFGTATSDGRPRPWGFGNMVPGPQTPFGSINPSPDTRDARSNGYNPLRAIRGFSQLHVSGTGSVGKYGFFLLSPQAGLATGEEDHDSEKADEQAMPGYYSVRLTRWGIRVEVTCAHNAAIYRITFPSGADANLLMDLAHNIPGDAHFKRIGGHVAAADVHVDPRAGEMRGMGRYVGGWGGGAIQAHFCLRVSRPPARFGVWHHGPWDDSMAASGELRARPCTTFPGGTTASAVVERDRIGAWFGFDTSREQTVIVKVGVSMSSAQHAAQFVDQQIPDWDFDAVRGRCEDQWEAMLARAQIQTDDNTARSIFYTCLYRSLMMPRDRTGDNPWWDSSEPVLDDHYCVWDTFRTVFPLRTLLYESSTRDSIRSFIDRFRHGGLVMDAFIGGRDLVHQASRDPRVGRMWGGMGGDMVDVVIADAFVKGVRGVDWEPAYEVLKFHADRLRCDPYRADDRGWVPFDCFANDDGSGLKHCSSFTIEMAYTDFCVAQVARGLGRSDDYQRYLARSRRWTALWNGDMELDGQRGFISARRSDGSWADDHAAANNGAFAEGTSWDYTHFVPHDLATLMALHGGAEKFAARLDYTLRHDKVVLDNEPTFLLMHCLNYAGRPDLCGYWVRRHMTDYSLEAFPGPDDSGAMASWGVWGMLGLFPNAGQDVYLLHGPSVPQATLRREDGSRLLIEAPNVSAQRFYVQSAMLNGQPLDRCWLRHDEIASGGTLRFVMGDRPSAWGRNTPPPSLPLL